MMTVAFYDARPYDREYFNEATEDGALQIQFFDFRLTSDTAMSATGAQAVCVFVNDHLDASCLEKIRDLGVELIAFRCAGFNNLDLAAAKSLGLAVVRVPAYSPYAVAEHTVALLMTLNRKIHRAFNRVREHNFSLSGLVGFDVHGKTVGIVGTGKIGRIAAQIFHGFGTRLLVVDPYPDEAWANTLGATYTDIETLLKESDIVSLHLPLTPESRYLLNAETLALMKPMAYLINTSRGKLVDTGALIQVIKSGGIGGVALDVYEEEEKVFFDDHSSEILYDDELSRLLSFPNVLITSHQAFLTHEALTEIARLSSENLLHCAQGTDYVAGSILVERPSGCSD